jgi:oligoendopeptidase F
LTRWSDLEKAVWDGRAVRKLAMYRDITNSAAEGAYQTYMTEVMAPFRTVAQALVLKLLALPDYTPAPEHEQIVRRWRSTAQLIKPEAASLQTEIAVLEGEYQRITRQIERACGVVPVPLLATPAAEALRMAEEAWRAQQVHWLEQRSSLDDLFLRLLQLRRRLAVSAGVANYRAYWWQENAWLDYTPQQAQAFHDAFASEIVPLVSRWRQDHAHQLGARDVRPWDLDVQPDQDPPLRPYRSLGELEAGVARLFARVDPQLGDLFAQLRPNSLFLGSDGNKMPVNEEFCLFASKQPYVFVHTDGSFHDVTLLLHEGGHALHDMLSLAHHDLIWNSTGMADACTEFAAMTAMFLPYPYLERDQGGFYSATDAIRAQRAQVERMVAYYLPQQTTEVAFQHWVFAQSPETITPADLDKAWQHCMARFQPDIHWAGLEPAPQAGWHQSQSSFTRPFSHLGRGLAAFGALQVWQNARADQATAVAAFKRMLCLGANRPLPEAYAMAGARLACSRDSVAAVATMIAPYLRGPHM